MRHQQQQQTGGGRPRPSSPSHSPPSKGSSSPRAKTKDHAHKIKDNAKKVTKGKSPDPSGGHSDTVNVNVAAQQMRRELANLDRVDVEQMESGTRPEGILGPATSKFDPETHVGTILLSTDRLCVQTQSGFATVRACTCVFKGKWQYEVWPISLIGSKMILTGGYHAGAIGIEWRHANRVDYDDGEFQC